MIDYGHELQFGIFSLPSAEGREGAIRATKLADVAGLDLVMFQDTPGITVNVADDSTTTFRADATNADGKSGCSTGSVTYNEVTPPPAGKVAFSKGPAKKSAKFTFSAPNAASYECNLDGKGYKQCSSPYKVKKLKPGKHNLQARAIGADGSPAAAATYKWTVKKKKKTQ